MNKEAAEDCVEKAVSYLSEGKIEKAEKLLTKSITLHPTKRAEGEQGGGRNFVCLSKTGGLGQCVIAVMYGGVSMPLF